MVCNRCKKERVVNIICKSNHITCILCGVSIFKESMVDNSEAICGYMENGIICEELISNDEFNIFTYYLKEYTMYKLDINPPNNTKKYIPPHKILQPVQPPNKILQPVQPPNKILQPVQPPIILKKPLPPRTQSQTKKENLTKIDNYTDILSIQFMNRNFILDDKILCIKENLDLLDKFDSLKNEHELSISIISKLQDNISNINLSKYDNINKDNIDIDNIDVDKKYILIELEECYNKYKYIKYDNIADKKEKFKETLNTISKQKTSYIEDIDTINHYIQSEEEFLKENICIILNIIKNNELRKKEICKEIENLRKQKDNILKKEHELILSKEINSIIEKEKIIDNIADILLRKDMRIQEYKKQ